jgi:hypothetical protein
MLHRRNFSAPRQLRKREIKDGSDDQYPKDIRQFPGPSPKLAENDAQSGSSDNGNIPL